MSINTLNLFSSEVQVYVAAAVEPLPEYDDVSGAINFGDSTGWVNISTSESVTLTHEKEFEGVKTNGILGKVKDILIGESAMVSLNMTEYNFEHWQIALGTTDVFTSTEADTDQVARDNLAVGNSQLEEYSIALYGLDPLGMYVLWYFPIVVSTGAFEKEFKHGHTTVKCEFDVLANPEDDGKLYHCYKMTDIAVS